MTISKYQPGKNSKLNMKINIIKEQISSTKEKTDKLIADFSAEKWLETPEVLNTNLNWQIGHIILANYLHGIASISGANEELREKINIPDYIKFYGPKSNPTDFINEKPNQMELSKIYEYTISLILENLNKLTENNLNENTVIPNPSVKTKYEALKWLSHHQSWHNGQIAMLKRVLYN
ncbi:DinB family protein [Aequorivita nionensis]|jgi:hypothetical protein|uniref:DinB family protein n=1 Tax=Aequorivita nionensis TaxID=1287690 RepID=UPI003965B216